MLRNLLLLAVLAPVVPQAEFDNIMTNAVSYETKSEYQVCERHEVGESYDCLSFDKIAYHTSSDGAIIASIKDIVYVVPEHGNIKRQEMSSLASINCEDYLVSVQIDPKSKWTHWEYAKKGELLRDVMDKICTTQSSVAYNG